MSDVQESTEALKIEITVTDSKVAYTHNMPPQQMIFWLEAVKNIVIEDALKGGKEDTSE